MTHLAMLDVDDEGNSVQWGEHVTDSDYQKAAQIDMPAGDAQ